MHNICLLCHVHSFKYILNLKCVTISVNIMVAEGVHACVLSWL